MDADPEFVHAVLEALVFAGAFVGAEFSGRLDRDLLDVVARVAVLRVGVLGVFAVGVARLAPGAGGAAASAS